MNPHSGGGVCCNRNLQSLISLFGKKNVTKFELKKIDKSNFNNYFKKLFKLLNGHTLSLNNFNLMRINEEIVSNKINYVFIEGSRNGLIAKFIKKKHPKITVISFCHNFEYKFMKDMYRYYDKLSFKKYNLYFTKKFEKYATKYSDKLICLTSRDKEDIERFYNCIVTDVIPISLKDSFQENQINKNIKSENKRALFIGSKFFGNTSGLKWFIKEILPYVDIQLTIIGNGMENLAKEIGYNNKITIIGRVDNLSPFYEKADFILLPIIMGGGMKIKTAEGLMNGKFIIGTDEAFEGYNISQNEGVKCNTKEEFINVLQNLSLNYKYNHESRNLFNKLYSYESTLPLFKKLLK